MTRKCYYKTSTCIRDSRINPSNRGEQEKACKQYAVLICSIFIRSDEHTLKFKQKNKLPQNPAKMSQNVLLARLSSFLLLLFFLRRTI